MKIALIGGGGFVGSHLLTELLERGHEVKSLARHPEKITVENAKLEVVKADVLNESEVEKAVGGSDVVLSSYNAGWTNPNIYEDFIKGSRSIQAGTKNAGVKRLIVIGGGGSLESAPGQQIVDSPDFPEEFKPGATAARDYLNILKDEQDLDWTFFSPALEMHQGIKTGRTGKYRLGLDNPVYDGAGRSILSAEDLAVVIADEIEDPKHIKKRFTAGY